MRRVLRHAALPSEDTAMSKHIPLSTEQKQERRAALMQKLTDGVDAIQDGEAFKRYLDFAAKLHNYSFNNLLLIQMQRPDAQMIAGFHRWRSLGRFVRKGEKGIMIFAPHTYKREDDPDNSTGLGFHVEHVFDVSQTEGEDLPTLDRATIPDQETDTNLWDSLLAFATEQGVSVSVDPMHQHGQEFGWYQAKTRMIYVQRRHWAGMTKTLAHEIGHHLDAQHLGDRPEAEAVAEATAYVIATAYGIDCAEYSFSYIAGWAGREKGSDLIRSVLGRITQNTRTLFAYLDTMLTPTIEAIEA
jgi:hypothetical protein